MTVAVTVVMLVGVAQTVLRVQDAYLNQRQKIESVDSAQIAMDLIVRVTRLAGNDPRDLTFAAIEPDPDGNGVLDSIRVRSDWNPANGALTDPLEDLTFATADGRLTVREGAAAAVPYVEGTRSLRFAYLGVDGAELTNPIANPASITAITVTLVTVNRGAPDMTFVSTAGVRARQLN